MITVHNKLVRDKIPDIIKSNGEKCEYRILSDNEYIAELELKLKEEVDEYLADKAIDELADILEVIYAIAKFNDIDSTQLEFIRLNKYLSRGAFNKKYYLSQTESN